MQNYFDGPGWLDISVPIRNGMVNWPGDVSVQIERRTRMEKGSIYNLSSISMSIHTGTHIDAPLHFLSDGKAVDTIPPDAVVGPARVIESRDNVSIKLEELASYNIKRGERILFKTRTSAIAWKSDSFIEDYVYVSKEAAEFLAGRGVKAVGIDYLSVAGYKAGQDVHVTLLRAGVWIIEGLDLSGVAPGNYYLICLPLRLVGAEGSPARALLKPIP